MHFCPLCCNLLLLENMGGLRFVCQTCSYVHDIRKPIEHVKVLEKKQVDDVLGGPDAWKNADKAEAKCGKCGNHEAYFQQMQTRSADEPMTTYYTCTKCWFNWKEN